MHRNDDYFETRKHAYLRKFRKPESYFADDMVLTYFNAFLRGVHGSDISRVINLRPQQAEKGPEVVILALLDRFIEVTLGDGVQL